MDPSSRGQASAEYAGVVLLVLVALGALTAAGAPWLPGAVLARVQHAICVVGLDVCGAAEARAAGLPPCTTAASDARSATSATVMRATLGDGSSIRVEERSDGTVLLTAGRENELGASAGFGFGLRVRKGEVGGSRDVALAFRRGETIVTDRAGLAWFREQLQVAEDPIWGSFFVEALASRLPAGRVTRFLELELAAGVSASLGLAGGDAGVSRALGSAGVRAAVGRSASAGVSTYYYDVGGSADGPLADVLPDVHDRRLAVAWQRSEPPVLTVTAADAAGGGRRIETEARMVLADPADRAAARRWVLGLGAVTDAGGRALAARMGGRALVQRFTYEESSADAGSFEVEGKLGVDAGLGHDDTVLRRRLVDARVLGVAVGGRRLDCLAPAT